MDIEQKRRQLGQAHLLPGMSVQKLKELTPKDWEVMSEKEIDEVLEVVRKNDAIL